MQLYIILIQITRQSQLFMSPIYTELMYVPARIHVSFQNIHISGQACFAIFLQCFAVSWITKSSNESV